LLATVIEQFVIMTLEGVSQWTAGFIISILCCIAFNNCYYWFEL